MRYAFRSSSFLLIAFFLSASARNNDSVATSLPLIQTIPIPGAKGRPAHMDIDVAGKRLFVAAISTLAAGTPKGH